MKDKKTGRYLLNDEDYAWAANELDCEINVIKAVAKVESLGSGFQVQRDGTVAPIILFEKHIFGELTGYKYNMSHPDISSNVWRPGVYGPSDYQHVRLAKAVKLNREAALMSCSWGKFQILGKYWKKLGYESLQNFINAQYQSEEAQLESFVKFIKSFGLQKYLIKKDFAGFAKAYNGKGYKINKYDTRLKEAYENLKSKGEL